MWNFETLNESSMDRGAILSAYNLEGSVANISVSYLSAPY